MKHLPTKNSAVAQILLLWFDTFGRSLPWRTTRNPYAIWLSEVILQQTRVDQGIPYWQRFIERLPSIEDLANASEDEVRGLWSGLGYYRRAQLLHRGAKILAERGWPTSKDEWLEVPGVGPYTAGALASILLEEPVPALDGNAYRVYARWSNWSAPIERASSKAFLAEFAAECVPKQRPGDFNQAVMDLAQAHCLPKKPRCGTCPVAEYCEAFRAGTHEALPVKRKRPEVRSEVWHFAVAQRDGKFGLVQRPTEGIWPGLWTPVPLEKAPPEVPADDVIHRLSHRKLHLKIYRTTLAESQVTQWMDLEEWRERGMPQAFVHWMRIFPYI